MKTLLGTSALALLFATAHAAAQTAPGQMTDPATTNPAQTAPLTRDMGAQPTMNQQNSTVQNTMGQSTMGQPAMGQTVPDQSTLDQSTPGTMDRSTMDRSTMDRSAMDNGTMGTPVQSTPLDQTTSTTNGARARATSPDGTNAFGIEPYFGILGGYDSYDRSTDINGNRSGRLDGAQIEGLIGVNIPLGAVFVGVEGHGARGFGDIRWEYGVRGRGGFRMGDSGLIYASAGYTWTNVLNRRGFDDRKSWVWGIGVEAGPRDIGLGGVTSRSGPRFRLSVETADFNSLRPMAGVIFHF